MKKALLFPLLLLAIASTGQIRYDNGPITSGNKFVLDGKWNKTSLTYFFWNGTADIAGNDERNAIRQAFQIWADYAPLTFTEVTSASAADIVIFWGIGDHGDGHPFDGVNVVLAHAYSPPSPGDDSRAGDVHFDDAETWTLAERPFLSGQPIDLVTVAAHEIGHALGLGHSGEHCALMNESYTGSHRFLAHDDLEGIRALYGTASPIRSLNAGCNGGTFFVNNLPTGATVTWTSSDPAIATVTTVNNQGVVTWGGVNSGQVTITADITLPSPPCNQIIVQSVSRHFGRPIIWSGTYTWTNGPTMGLVEGLNNVCLSARPTIMTTNMDIRGATSVVWNKDVASTGLIWGQTGNNLALTFRALNLMGEFYVTASNACGSAQEVYAFKSISCPSLARTNNQEGAAKEQVKLSPNPAGNYVNIIISKNAAATSMDFPADFTITGVKVYDLLGRLRISQQINKSSTANINVSGLTNGIYFVEITDGTRKIKKNLQIVR